MGVTLARREKIDDGHLSVRETAEYLGRPDLAGEQAVRRWFDADMLRGYRLPGGQYQRGARRITKASAEALRSQMRAAVMQRAADWRATH